VNIPLTDEEIDQRLLLLPRWRRAGKTLECRVEFSSFAAAIGFVASAAIVAEKLDHHPDLDIRWRAVVVRLSTHDAGGVTDLDFALLALLEPLLPGAPEPVN
jgi:4a-hydroxytetrahydrobiopterin dehydratase